MQYDYRLFFLDNVYDYSDWACSPMVGRSSGTLPTRVQIMVLAPFPGLIPALCVSGKRCSRRRRDASDEW
jgi:hypothetical protein